MSGQSQLLVLVLRKRKKGETKEKEKESKKEESAEGKERGGVGSAFSVLFAFLLLYSFLLGKLASPPLRLYLPSVGSCLRASRNWPIVGRFAAECFAA